MDFAHNEVIWFGELEGTGRYKSNGSASAGINYQLKLTQAFSFETGLEYSRNEISITPAFDPSIDMTPRKTAIEMLTVPVYGNYTFLKHLFINGGLSLDLETNSDRIGGVDRQSGIGIGLGFGGKYSMKNIEVYVNPFLRQHAMLPFNKENYQQQLLDFGLRFGLGVNF